MLRPRALLATLALVLLAAPGAHAAPRKTRSSTSKKGRASAPASEPQPSEAASAPAQQQAAPSPAAESSAPAAAPAPARTAAARAEPARARLAEQAPAEPPARLPPPRIGLGLDLFGEGSQMSGGQWIDSSHREESFEYGSSKFVSGSAWLLFARSERLRFGPGVRVFGNYSAGGDRPFTFGVLTEALALAEYGLPVHGPYEAVLGARGGLAMLLPGGALADEINRLRTEGAGVWNVPRFGWTLGLSAGARRKMTERISLRADLGLQMERLYLFATDQEVEGLHFQKNWTTRTLRLGLTLGAEFAL
ncbi:MULTISPECIES: hypothetical protein [Myxococcaceae]|uniref:hypothetical protein n=1 Tax=Myxococcaceae TaxID=31 RepID=UPI00129CA95B|nr:MULTISPECIES: hypothetical protein [Myxococcaceae]MBF5042931.1 hypothetical protein [Simulacricoccus sp. 17bor-14]